MPPAKVYRIDQLKPKGYLSQIDDLSGEEQRLIEEQKEASRALFSLLLSTADESDDLTIRRRRQQEQALRRRVQQLSRAVEEMFSARGRQAYLGITGYTEQTLLHEAHGRRAAEHLRHTCYLCEPMKTLGWSRRRALGEAVLSLYLQLHGSRLEGELAGTVERRWDEGRHGPLELQRLAEQGFPILVEIVREGVSALVKEVLRPHLAAWQGSGAAARAMGGGDRYLMAESIARLLIKNSTPRRAPRGD
jgi:hypothetical protein